MPERNLTSAGQRNASLLDIVNWLDVEAKRRYLRHTHSTWCNIYAYDVCYLAGAYLPRVWWTDEALRDWSRDKTVQVKYKLTVNELSANSLFNWLEHWGGVYGWKRAPDPSSAQTTVNRGSIGVVCAATKNPRASGHITVIVPESGAQTALRDASGTVVAPVQSQAGAKNRELFASAWWGKVGYRSWGAWTHA